MENHLTIFIWICVIIANFEAKPLPLNDAKIFFIRKHVTCPSNSTFYAPQNVEMHCTTTALDCYLRELDGNIRKKCNDATGHLDYTVEFLNKTIHEWKDSRPLTNSSECACEHWPKMPKRGFIDKMESLLQRLNN